MQVTALSLVSLLRSARTILRWRHFWIGTGTAVALMVTHAMGIKDGLAFRPPASLMKPPPPPDCTLHPVPTGLPIARRTRISSADRDATHIELVVGGDELVVEVESDQPLTDWLSAMRISAKTGDYEVFQSVCPSMSPNAAGRLFSVHVKTARRISTLWRVEVFTAKSSGSKRDLKLTFKTQQAGTGIETFFWTPLDTVTATAFLCSDGKKLVAPKDRLAAGAHGVLLVRVSFGTTETRLSETQRQLASEELKLALSMWSHACADCSPEHFAAIEIDGIMHVRGRLLDWYRSELEEAPRQVGMRLDANCLGSGRSAVDCFVPILSGDLDRLDESLASALESISQLMTGDDPVPTGKLLDMYTAIPDVATRLPKLCSLVVDVKTAPLASKIKRIICSPNELAKRERVKLQILFREGAIGCDNSAETIACRVDPELIEYNIRDFSFGPRQGDQGIIGRGAVRITLLHVLVHELGHWLGLGHADVGEGIMASSLRQARCIDVQTTDALRRRASGFAGLKGANQTFPSAFRLNPLHTARPGALRRR